MRIHKFQLQWTQIYQANIFADRPQLFQFFGRIE